MDINEITNNVSDIAENLQWEVAKAFPTPPFKELLLNMLPVGLTDGSDLLGVDWSIVDADDYSSLYDYDWKDCVNWDAYNNAPIYHIILDDGIDIMVHATNADMLHHFVLIVEEVLSVHHCEDEHHNRV